MKMRKAIVITIHLLSSTILSVASISHYILRNQISSRERSLALLGAIILLCVDYFVSLYYSDFRRKWVHWFDLPLLAVPNSFIILMLLTKHGQYSYNSQMEPAEIVLLLGILSAELCLLGERIRLIRLSD